MIETANPPAVRREPLRHRREHVAVNLTTADSFWYTAGLGYFEDGRLAEVFLNAEETGAAIEIADAGGKQ
jgi:hypothetical protein